MQFDHVGVPTEDKHALEMFVAATRVWVTDPFVDPHKIECRKVLFRRNNRGFEVRGADVPVFDLPSQCGHGEVGISRADINDVALQPVRHLDDHPGHLRGIQGKLFERRAGVVDAPHACSDERCRNPVCFLSIKGLEYGFTG